MITKVCRSLHKIFVLLGERFGGGFLGSLPTDIWSMVFTSWLRLAGADIDMSSRVHRKVYVRHPENIKIGKRVMVPASIDMAGMGKIEIGDDSLIGASVRFLTNHHPLDDDSLTRDQQRMGTQQHITVGKNCWIMNNVLLVAGKNGLTIGDNVWIAAGSIVTKDIESNVLVGASLQKLLKN
jgi:acetyltransferase-like isoleucine patch superfamily enzyme